MNEGIGNTLHEIIAGQDLTINSDTIKWIKLNTYDQRLEICEGEKVFSDTGYCLHKEKFMRMKSNPLSITIK